MSEKCKFQPVRLWIACEGTGTGVSTGGRAHSPHVCKFLLRMLGYVLHKQPTVVLRVSSSREVNAWICAQRATDRDLEGVFFANAWICAQRATDRDLESVFVKRKVNAWIYARHSTDRDLESVFNVNAWICACQTTDRDLETKK